MQVGFLLIWSGTFEISQPERMWGVLVLHGADMFDLSLHGSFTVR
jgi:hypothetical protein